MKTLLQSFLKYLFHFVIIDSLLMNRGQNLSIMDIAVCYAVGFQLFNVTLINICCFTRKGLFENIEILMKQNRKDGAMERTCLSSSG